MSESTMPKVAVPSHWSPEQDLAVFECLHALRSTLWEAYGPQVQQAWRDQLVPDGPPPEFDPDDPFSRRLRLTTQQADGPSRGHLHFMASTTLDHHRQVIRNRTLTAEWRRRIGAHLCRRQQLWAGGVYYLTMYCWRVD